MKNIKKMIPFIATLIGAVLMAAAIFMPYSKAIGNHAERIEDDPDAVVYEDPDITAGELLNVSMFEYAKLYLTVGEDMWDNSFPVILYTSLVALIGLFALLAVLFTLLKKPVRVIVFDILAFIVFVIQNWDYSDRGVVPSRKYDWGAGYYVFFVAAAVVFIGAILMKISQSKAKKEQSSMENN